MGNATERYDEATRAITKQIEAYITEYFGERCAPSDPDCACCKAWARYDSLRELFID